MGVFEQIRQISCNEAAQRLGLQGGRTSPGRGVWRCPFHDDHHPSMTCYDHDNRFYCFSCKASGDAANLYAKVLGLSNYQAAVQACRDFGLAWDGRSSRHQAPPERKPSADAVAVGRGVMALSRVWKAFLLRIARQEMDAAVMRLEQLANPDHPAWYAWLSRAVRFQDEYNRVEAMTDSEMLEQIKEELANPEEIRPSLREEEC